MKETDKQVAGLEAYVETGDFSAYYGKQYGCPHDPSWPWGGPILNRFLLPFLGEDKTVMEIGSGGGRWSQFIMPRCLRTILVDGTSASEAAIRGAHGVPGNRDVRFYAAPTGAVPAVRKGTVDFVFSMDTFVHFDEDLFDRYLKTIARVLRKNCVLCLYYAWDHAYGHEFFRYYDPEAIVAKLAAVGLEHFGDDLLVYDSRFIKARRV